MEKQPEKQPAKTAKSKARFYNVKVVDRANAVVCTLHLSSLLDVIEIVESTDQGDVYREFYRDTNEPPHIVYREQ